MTFASDNTKDSTLQLLKDLITGLASSPPTAAFIGILLGWGLKSLSDYFSMRRTEARTFRKATFFIMRAWKALLDYERGIAYFRGSRPDVEEFEAKREMLERRFLARIEVDRNTTNTAVDLLASVDPPLATRIDNTFKNLLITFGNGYHRKVLETDPDVYAQLIYKHDEIVDFSLSDLWTASLKLSARCGVMDRIRVGVWFKTRVGKGRDEFYEGMAEHADLLERIGQLKPSGNQKEPTQGEPESGDSLA